MVGESDIFDPWHHPPRGEIEAVSRIFAEKERLAEKKAQEADLSGGPDQGARQKQRLVNGGWGW